MPLQAWHNQSLGPCSLLYNGLTCYSDGPELRQGVVIVTLTRSPFSVAWSTVLLQASLLCKATYEGKLDRLALLLKAGCDPDAHDYGGLDQGQVQHYVVTITVMPAMLLLVG